MTRMLRAAAGVTALALGACAHIEVDRRVERGPTLRTFERELVAEGGTAGEIDPRWPLLEVSLSAYDVCRTHKVEEFAEEHITERSAPSAGPALTLGVVDSLLAAGLYLGRPAFSSAPNTRSIDQGGHYGPSDRQLATNWSIGLAVVGLPALVVGIIEYAQIGEDVEIKRAEQVVSATERACNPRPVNGKLELADTRGATALSRDTVAGKASFTADELRGRPVDRLLFAGRAVEVRDADLLALEAFRACAGLPALDSLQALGLDELAAALGNARLCRAIPGGPGLSALSALEAEVARRGAEQAAGLSRPGPRLESFDDALAAYAPKLHFAEGSADLARLSRPDELVGQAATLTGILAERPEANIGVLQVGPEKVLVFVPADVPWAFDYASGSRLEVLGVVMGHQAFGSLTAPLFRAVWMRPAPAR